MLFFSWVTAIQYIKKSKKNELINEFTVENKNRLIIWCFVIFNVMLIISTIQCYSYLSSIFGTDMSGIVDGLQNYVDLSEYRNESLMILNGGIVAFKVYMIPAKILKYILQVVFGTLSVIVFYVKNCLKKLIKIPKSLRNILMIN